MAVAVAAAGGSNGSSISSPQGQQQQQPAPPAADGLPLPLPLVQSILAQAPPSAVAAAAAACKQLRLAASLNGHFEPPDCLEAYVQALQLHQSMVPEDSDGSHQFLLCGVWPLDGSSCAGAELADAGYVGQNLLAVPVLLAGRLASGVFGGPDKAEENVLASIIKMVREANHLTR